MNTGKDTNKREASGEEQRRGDDEAEQLESQSGCKCCGARSKD